MADNSLIVEGVNIAKLSDDGLKMRLQELGFTPGPILVSTRSVYERKLAKLLQRGGGDEMEGSDEEEEEEEERPLTPNFNYTTFREYSSPSAAYSTDELRRRPLPRVSDSSFASSPSKNSPVTSWNINDIVTQVEPPAGELEKPLLSTSTKIICLIVVVILALLVYGNMESAPDNPFADDS